MQLLLQAVHGLFDVLLALARAAAHPVAVAQFVDHRAADALAGEGLELHALRGLVTRDGLGQADHADLDQVVELHARGQLGDHVMRQATDQGAVLAQLVLAVERAFGGVHRQLQKGMAAPACAPRAGER